MRKGTSKSLGDEVYEKFFALTDKYKNGNEEERYRVYGKGMRIYGTL